MTGGGNVNGRVYGSASQVTIDYTGPDVSDQVADKWSKVFPQENCLPTDLWTQIFNVQDLAFPKVQGGKDHIVGQSAPFC